MHLLAARLPLPDDHRIFFALYRPTTASIPDAIEHARATRPPLSLASPDLAHDPALYLFHIAHHNDDPLASLSFPGLAVTQSGSHTPASIQTYPVLLSHFCHAFRAHLISDVVTAAASSSHSRKLRCFKNGFLISQCSAGSSDWEYKSISRPLVFCQLQIILQPAHILVHPLLISTPFLDIAVSLPLPPGTPITLLPYGTPAYFLATYTGPTAGLIKQFQASLSGLGAGDWDSDATPSFIIAYIKVENKQGEDKGITIIYPSKLCVSTIPGASPARSPLQYIPELPPPLQPSPPIAPTLPSASGVAYQSLNPGVSASAPTSPYPHPNPSSNHNPRRPSIFSSPTSESLHAFRALHLSKTNDLRQVAVEVGGYVDAVARERERERERLRKEREGTGSAMGNSPKLSRAPPQPSTPGASMSVHADPGQSTPHRMQSINAVAGPSNAVSYTTQNVAPPLMPAPQIQIQPSQSFYPSPPQTVPAVGQSADNITSPVVENPPLSAVSSTNDLPPPQSPAPPAPPSTSSSLQQPTQQQQDDSARFDSYMMDQSAWASAQVADAYMGGMDMGMDFMGMDMGGMDIGGMSGMDMNGMGMGMNLGDISLGDTFGMNMDMNMMDMEFGLGPPQPAATTAMHSAGSAANAGAATASSRTAAAPVPVSAPVSVSAPITTASARSGRVGGNKMNFDDLSDDDFSFFDTPAAAPPPPPPVAVAHAPAGTHHHNHSFGSDLAGTDPSTTHNGQIWTPGAFMDGFAPTPGPADVHSHHAGASGDLAPPDLMPSSPGSTPADSHSHSAPATPAAGVHLAYDAAGASSMLVKRTDSGHPGSSASGLSASGRFEPIPFASYHRRADGKYFAGKFAALPSPPPDSPHGETTVAGVSGPPPVTLSSSLPASSAAGTASSSGTNMGYFYHRPPPPPAHGGGGSMLSFSSLPTSPGSVGGNGWRLRYNAQTDPRIGVITKLIGVKRKTPTSVLHGTRDPPKTERWVGSCVSKEEWELPQDDRDKEEEEMDEEEEEEEEDEVGEDVDEDDPETPLKSRPTTPPPSYLPLGPTLLHTQFQHAYLLPLSVPLRPPGAAVAPVNLAAGANVHGTGALPSVPTPVSPAATMGAATERSKSLEMVAAAVAAEVVENPVWAEMWRASSVGANAASSVWSADYKAVAQLLKSVPGLEAPVSIADLFDLDTSEESKPLEPLEAPMISIGKGDAVIQVLPTALRFWEKLGLHPKGGQKDLSAYVLYEDNGGEQRHTLVGTWLANVSNMYQSKHLGKLNFGKSSMCTKDGHLPIRFDVTLRKTLISFIASLSPPQPTIVVFLVLPLAAMSLSSPVLRQILAVATKIFNGYQSSVLSVQFVPEQHLFSAMERSPTAFSCSLDQLCLAVYNRLPIAVDRVRTATVSNSNEVSDIRAYFSAPSIALSRPVYNKVSYVRAAHPSLDVLDRYTLLHIGYHLTSCGRWIIACGVDQRGEMHEVGVWLTREAGQGDPESDPEINEDEYAVKKVWDFGIQLARKANVEWRVVFTRLGVMHEKELHAWTTCLERNVAASRSQPPLHHTVCCVVPNAPWLLLSKPTPSNRISTSSVLLSPQPARSLPALSKSGLLFVDASTSTYAIFPRNSIPISIPPSQSDLGLSQSFIVEPPIQASMPSSPHPDSYNSHPATPVTHTETNSTLSSSSSSHSPTSAHLPHAVSVIPQLNSILFQVPHTLSATTIGMIHIHLLRTVHSASYTNSLQASSLSSARVPDDESLLADVTQSFHELAVLAKVGYNLNGVGGHNDLPFHLAAVDAMRMALDRDLDRSEVGSDS